VSQSVGTPLAKQEIVYMEFEQFIQIIDKLYEDRSQYNIDAWRVGGFFYNITETTPVEIKETFFKYTKQVRVHKKVLNELVALQHKYRTLFGWDEIVEYLIEAFGYLGQKSNKFSDHLFESITSKVKEDKHGISAKYFLTFCLTTAAKVNLHSIDLLWKLHWCSWAGNWIWDSRTVDKEEIEEEFIQLDENVHRGLRDSMRVLDIASPKVISFLILKLNNAYYHTPPMVWVLVNQILGDTPEVKCLLLNKEGDYVYQIKDFADQVLVLLGNPNNLGNIENLFLKWCKNDRRFRQRTSEVLDDTDTEISYLIHYLIMKLREANRKVRDGRKLKEELATMSEKDRQEVDSTDLHIWQKRANHLESDEKHKEFLENSIARLKNGKARVEDSQIWRNAMYEKRFDRFSFAGEAYDYINYHRFTFRQRIMVG
jgi:hypothetical protein